MGNELCVQVMFERMKKEKEEGSKQKEGSRVEVGRDGETVGLSGTLQRLNSYSSFLNVMTLMSLTWHLVHLSKLLHHHH